MYKFEDEDTTQAYGWFQEEHTWAQLAERILSWPRSQHSLEGYSNQEGTCRESHLAKSRASDKFLSYWQNHQSVSGGRDRDSFYFNKEECLGESEIDGNLERKRYDSLICSKWAQLSWLMRSLNSILVIFVELWKNKIMLAIGKGSDFKKEATFFLCKIAKELLEKRIIRWKHE